jgi:hypothetical protein
MVCNTQNYWSIVRYSRSKVRPSGNWISFRPQVRWETPTLLGPLENATRSHWTDDGNRSSFRNVVFSSFSNTG